MNIEYIEKGLTGKFCHRKNFWGNLILWVEVKGVAQLVGDPYDLGQPRTWWRKAAEMDLSQLKLVSSNYKE